MYRTGIKILKATVGVESEKKDLLPSFVRKIDIESLLVDYCSVEEIPYSDNLDGHICVKESPGDLSYTFSEKGFIFDGPFLEFERKATDLRYSLWGSQGFLYRYIQYLLEKHHNIYNFHACALFEEKKRILYVIIGGAGSGKTVYLLSALEKGLKLFSTETVHFSIKNGTITWYMGSLVDNIRIGNLKYDFPRFLPESEKHRTEKVWQKKIALDLTSYKTDFTEIKDPSSVQILFPRIEQGRKGFVFTPFSSKKAEEKALFDNISQKMTETVLIYDKMPVLGFDEQKLAKKRYEAVRLLAGHDSIAPIFSVLSNPGECWR
jgi:hypothetical protein